MKIVISQDISEIEPKFLFGLPKRQIIGFSLSAVLGIPTYWLSYITLGKNSAALLLSLVIFPILMCTFVKKEDMPLEVYLKQKYLHIFYRTRIRRKKGEKYE